MGGQGGEVRQELVMRQGGEKCWRQEQVSMCRLGAGEQRIPDHRRNKVSLVIISETDCSDKHWRALESEQEYRMGNNLTMSDRQDRALTETDENGEYSLPADLVLEAPPPTLHIQQQFGPCMPDGHPHTLGGWGGVLARGQSGLSWTGFS